MRSKVSSTRNSLDWKSLAERYFAKHEYAVWKEFEEFKNIEKVSEEFEKVLEKALEDCIHYCIATGESYFICWRDAILRNHKDRQEAEKFIKFHENYPREKYNKYFNEF